jgi:hypothetical protein
MHAFSMLVAAFLMAASNPANTVEAFGYKWKVAAGAEWAVDGSGTSQVLRMLVARPSTQPRRPSQYALAETPPFENVTIEAEVKRDKTSLIFVYAWRDENHFNYAHLSIDSPTKQPVHNGIFHVYGGDRVRISAESGPGSLPSEDWTPVKLTWSAKSGEVRVDVGGNQFDNLHAVDLSLGPGRVGLGSFFETAQFRNVRIKGTPARAAVP